MAHIYLHDYELISSVLPGQTINVSTREVFYHTYINGIYRWWYVEDKQKLLTWLIHVVKDELTTSLSNNQKCRLRGLMRGLYSLSSTYYKTCISYGILDLIHLIENKLNTIHVNITNPFSGSYFNRY
jgi:hypothetical protein